MSKDPFPERVVARKLCQQKGTINSTVSISKLQRFSEYLDDHDGQVKVSLHFDKDESGYRVVRGQVETTVSILCQRCLEPTEVGVASELTVTLADTEAEANKIADRFSGPLDKLEVIVCEEGELNLLTLVEDELIMSLPVVVAHEDKNCNTELNAIQADSDSVESVQGNIEGLDALEKLKIELKKDKQ
jgi:uncharacterized protein